MQQEKRAPFSLATLWSAWRERSRLRYVGYALAVAAALLLYFAGTDRISCAARAAPAESTVTLSDGGRDRLELRLIEVLSEIRGAGRVDVLVTYETAGEIDAAEASRADAETNVRGVIVVAEGAALVSVRKDLENAVRAVTGVSLSRIEVFEMRSDAYAGTEE